MSETSYEAVIGLEVHAQLQTRTKIFCGCRASFGAEPNTQICPVCLGLPGALPVLNREAVSMAMMIGLATGCRIANRSVFARKNYFYPDSPKNYQISMYDLPLCEDGCIEFEMEDDSLRIGIERIHLEDDAGKLLHGEEGMSLVDFNRCGVPLIEIVSRPDIRSARAAGRYLVKLRQLVRYLGICDGNMEEGSLRCDVNVSVRPSGAERLGTRTEIKNLNSFKAVEMGIRFEIERQMGILEGGGSVEQVTSLWNTAQKRLEPMRTKEHAQDYRYFPEPDLPVLEIDESWIDSVRSRMPELPLERERRFMKEYGLPPYDAEVLCSEKGIATYFEETVSLAGDAKITSNWIMREVLEELKTESAGIGTFPITPARLAGLIGLVKSGAVSGTAGRDVFKEMLVSGDDAPTVVERLGLEQISGEGELETMVEEVLAENPKEVERYRGGKTQLLGYFVGQVMKRSGGKANPKLTNEILREKLKS